MTFTLEQQHQVRGSLTCPGCGSRKDFGCLVCWPCFKDGDNPFKYFGASGPSAGDLEAWLASIGRPPLKEQGLVNTCRCELCRTERAAVEAMSGDLP